MKTRNSSSALSLGGRIRQYRKQCGLSLEQVSAKSGVALATLSRIENDKGSGTLRTHQRISDAFGLTLAELYKNLQPQQEDAEVIRSQADEAESFIYDQKASAIFLARQVAGKQMLPQLILLQPGGKTSVEQYPPRTERWVFGLEGEISVRVANKEYPVGPGETIYFKASLAHQFHNDSHAPARLISVTSPAVL
jgi:transcriptional regulator with XRE-family HTH domain